MKNLKPYLQIHTAVALFGFTAILGDLISIPAIPLVWWRVLITCFSLFFLINVVSEWKKLPTITLFKLLGIGILVGIHWITFYGAIKASNASITLICMATATLFTAFIEPILFKAKMELIKVVFGLLVIPGMVLVVNTVDGAYMTGIYLGLSSAFLAALFSTCNKFMIKDLSPEIITFVELFGAWLFVSITFLCMPSEWLYPFMPFKTDWIYLLILALACTTFAYILSLKALEKLSAFETNLVVNLEPVYGIVLAIVILGEHHELTFQFYAGVILIMLAVFSFPFANKLLK